MSSDRTYFHSVAPAKPRTGETLEGAVAYARGYSGGGGGSGSIDPGSVGSNLSIVAGDRILVEETQGVIRTMVKISHAVPKEEDIDSQTTAEEADFVKNLHLDKQGHVVKAEVQSVGQLFDKRYLRKDQPDETNFRVTFRGWGGLRRLRRGLSRQRRPHRSERPLLAGRHAPPGVPRGARAAF